MTLRIVARKEPDNCTVNRVRGSERNRKVCFKYRSNIV
jgi:hypothetical protein